MKSLPLQVRLLPLFRDLNNEAFGALSRSCTYKALSRGDTLCNKGDPSNGLFVLMRGQLQVYEVSRDGQEVGLNLLKGPTVFGELGVIDDSPRSADIMALTPADVAIIPKSILMQCFTETPQSSLAMFRHLTSMVRRLTQHQSVLAIPSATQRVCAMLVELCNRQTQSDVMELDLPKQKELATMVNTTRETVSRTLGQLVDQKVVKKSNGKLLVLQPESLRQWAGLD
jgi:CRP/FNR family cyclic AMP-dependent transcriptional regulator